MSSFKGGGMAPHADLFLAELFGGVVNKAREGTLVQIHQSALARVSGLREAKIHDLVHFSQPDGSFTQGLVVDLEQNTVAVALLDMTMPVEGAHAVLADTALSMPVGPSLLGRVVDPLGRPLPDLEPAMATKQVDSTESPSDRTNTKSSSSSSASLPSTPIMSSQRRAPGIMARKPLCHRLRTGVKVLDVFHPLGHGQSVGLFGRPGSGKSTLALQIIANQNTAAPVPSPTAPLHCVYVAIGQEPRAVQEAVGELTRRACFQHVTVVAATQDMPPGLRFLAPFAGCAQGEYWRDQGGRALVVCDDLSRHAAAYSEMAKFMQKPEVEHGLALHGPLLERCAQMSDAKGGGAMTGLVVVEGEVTSGQEGGVGGGKEDGGHGLAHRINSLVDHAITLNVGLAQRRVFPAVDVTQQMNLPSAGAALLPEPAKWCVQQLRMMWAEALDKEAGAKLAERLGIQAVEEGEEGKVEWLEYLKKVRILFEQRGPSGEGAVLWTDEAGLVLLLMCCLQRQVLGHLDAGTVRALERIMAEELPRAAGWRKLRREVEALTQHADVRTVAEAFAEAHMTAQRRVKGGEREGDGGRGEFGQGGFTSPSMGKEGLALNEEVNRVYKRCSDVLAHAINYAQKKQQIAKLTNSADEAGDIARSRSQTNVSRRR